MSVQLTQWSRTIHLKRPFRLDLCRVLCVISTSVQKQQWVTKISVHRCDIRIRSTPFQPTVKESRSANAFLHHKSLHILYVQRGVLPTLFLSKGGIERFDHLHFLTN